MLSPNTAWEADSPDGSRSDVPEWDAPPDEDDEVENRVAVSEGISPSALFNLGIKSLNGDGGSSDPGKAAAFFLIAAKAGHPRAQYTLGTLYEKGTGVVRNYAKAVRWYRLAADQGDIDGQYALGRMFYDGKGVTQDYGEAAKWLLGAAEQGDTDAQYIVGTMFENATGVPQDKIQAHMWFNLSARLSHDEKGRRTAIEAREVLANKMTAMEVTQAQHLARDKFEHGFGPKRKR